MNRTQALVLGFFGAAWLALVALLVAALEVYAANVGAADRAAQALFLAALTAFLALLALGVARRWRWTFWLITVAFVAGALRVPAAALELAGYRRGGVWAAF